MGVDGSGFRERLGQGFRERLGQREIRYLRITAGGLAILVAWLHVLHPDYGYRQLLHYLQFGTVYDPRPPLFVLSGLAIFVGLGLAYRNVARETIYRLGLALTATFFLGFVTWHTLLDHGAFWPHIEGYHRHDVSVVTVIVDHLVADPIALVSKVAEAILFVVLALLTAFDVE